MGCSMSNTVTADNRHIARVFLTQARATKHASWRATLLGWARKRRTAGRQQPRQLDLFGMAAPSCSILPKGWR